MAEDGGVVVVVWGGGVIGVGVDTSGNDAIFFDYRTCNRSLLPIQIQPE